jgi:hypothetical protein
MQPIYTIFSTYLYLVSHSRFPTARLPSAALDTDQSERKEILLPSLLTLSNPLLMTLVSDLDNAKTHYHYYGTTNTTFITPMVEIVP